MSYTPSKYISATQFALVVEGDWLVMERGSLTPQGLAEIHANILRRDGRTWVTMRPVTSSPNVLLEYGTIHANGQEERAIATRTYYPTDEVECGVHYWTAIHC